MIKTPFVNDGDSRWSPVAYLVCLVVVAGIVDLAALGPGATTANAGAHDYRDQFGNLAQALIRDVYVDVVEAWTIRAADAPDDGESDSIVVLTGAPGTQRAIALITNTSSSDTCPSRPLSALSLAPRAPPLAS